MMETLKFVAGVITGFIVVASLMLFIHRFKKRRAKELSRQKNQRRMMKNMGVREAPNYWKQAEAAEHMKLPVNESVTFTEADFMYVEQSIDRMHRDGTLTFLSTEPHPNPNWLFYFVPQCKMCEDRIPDVPNQDNLERPAGFCSRDCFERYTEKRAHDEEMSRDEPLEDALEMLREGDQD
jgi:hypothetical protein